MSVRLYRPVLQGILADRVQTVPAISFYLLYILGLTLFAVVPGITAGRSVAALARGAMFGFFTYMTYDLTNQATLKSWSWGVTLADLGWGTLASAVAAALGCAVVLAL